MNAAPIIAWTVALGAALAAAAFLAVATSAAGSGSGRIQTAEAQKPALCCLCTIF